jgi:hypothetical protein
MLELLLALMIMAVLMVGVLAVVTDLSGRASAGAQDCTGADLAPAMVDAWVRQLRQELACGAIETAREDELTVVGYMALGSADRGVTHRPVRVVYRIEDIGGRAWVVRQQTLLDVPANQGVQRELVCSGVPRFEFVRAGGPVAAGTPGGSWRLRVWAREQEAPSQDRLVLAESGGGT